MAPTTPQALILDNGELADVRALLSELGVSHANGPLESREPVPLLVTTPTRARALHRGENGETTPAHHVHLVVADAHTTDLRGALDGARCDFLVRRPVETAVLGLITRRAGYVGPERRRVPRVAIGAPVRVRLEGEDEAREATLAQLSIAGCGLVTAFPPAVDAQLTIEFPAELTAPRGLTLAGRVPRVREVDTGDGRNHDVSVVFENPTLGDRVTLRALMAGQPIDFRPRQEGTRPAEPTRPPRLRRRALPAGGDRRAAPRRRFRRRILGGVEESARVLMGRDISTGGVRVERDPDLSLGDHLKVALYGEGDASPVLLQATVARDDGEDGWFLEFQELAAPVSRDLARLLQTLAPLDPRDPVGRAVCVISS